MRVRAGEQGAGEHGAGQHCRVAFQQGAGSRKRNGLEVRQVIIWGAWGQGARHREWSCNSATGHVHKPGHARHPVWSMVPLAVGTLILSHPLAKIQAATSALWRVNRHMPAGTAQGQASVAGADRVCSPASLHLLISPHTLRHPSSHPTKRLRSYNQVTPAKPAQSFTPKGTHPTALSHLTSQGHTFPPLPSPLGQQLSVLTLSLPSGRGSGPAPYRGPVQEGWGWGGGGSTASHP